MAAQFILDISRLFSRRHLQHDTGIDRVERGYLEYFRKLKSTYFLVKFAGIRFILTENQIDRLFRLESYKSGAFFSKLRIILALQKLAKNSKTPQKLKFYKNATFINVGHTGHKSSFWKAVRQANIRVVVMIHDIIPLDFPEYSRADKIKVFERKFQNWCRYADVILTPSEYSKNRILAWASTSAEIKVTPLFAQKTKLPKIKEDKNAWIILGTIEPRKNHLLLFKAWERMVKDHGSNAPQLWIIGSRGWPDDATLSFLDHSELMGTHVIEWGALDDETLLQKMAAAKGLLFPSYCEGFGLPIYEAVLSDKALFASRIPAFEEALGESSDCLLDINDDTIWMNAIMEPSKFGKVNAIKSWSAHIQMAI